ncbi:LrgB-like family-domain-containing protein [Cantharellus anzutake]|uniref:LrgB-like family-domain-containing protein n=1 Tax=Cantharellus anzutake TaxID=1750568 RepID=UPI0019048824|nr:LrgB-like family-domain-containing protein [Cantharellus anzutake]KAF8324907.1 LrgB-like family-domain-containing protein [Cantharellus anzutake]
MRNLKSAVVSAWKYQSTTLFLSWVHIPFVMVSLLAYSFAVDLLITSCFPFPFPSPVACMVFLFAILLLLDYLSLVFPASLPPRQLDNLKSRESGLLCIMSKEAASSLTLPRHKRNSIHAIVVSSTQLLTAPALPLIQHASPIPIPLEAKRDDEELQDAERLRLAGLLAPAAQNDQASTNRGGFLIEERRRFVDPVMRVLGKPCMFCLRHMVVMFTPAFILIPAREPALPAREIGLIIGWFVASQIFAVFLYRGLDLVYDVLRALCHERSRTEDIEMQSSDVTRQGSLNVTRVNTSEQIETPSPAVNVALRLGTRRGSLNTVMVSEPLPSDPSVALRTNSPIPPRISSTPTKLSAPPQVNDLGTLSPLAKSLVQYFNVAIYASIALISLPIFFAVKSHASPLVALPLFLSLNILFYLIAVIMVPAHIKKYGAHPILVCSILTLFTLWALGAIRGWSLRRTLRDYSSGSNYLTVWHPGFSGPLPGAGDILKSTLDVGIIALAIPMYRYRHELKRYFVRMILVILPCNALAFFFFPVIAGKIGIPSPQALTFAARFMSTPLAIELVEALKGDESVCVILVVVTGIVAVVTKDVLLYKILRVNQDDFLCVGLAMGTTSGAIGASSLIQEPQTMAIASLSFVLYGSVLLIAAAVPAVINFVRSRVENG